MGKRANIRATRVAAEASERELRRQTEIAEEARRAAMTPTEREADDRARAARAAAEADEHAKNMVGAAYLILALFGSFIVAKLLTVWGMLVCWVVIGVLIAVHKHRKAEAARQAAADTAAAAQARRDAEVARRAQVEHHVRLLCAGDPVFTGLVSQWEAIPPTRPGDRARNEAHQRERLVIIEQYAAEFAELERTGQPVPDHGQKMRDLVAAERSWDSRRRATDRRPGMRPRSQQ